MTDPPFRLVVEVRDMLIINETYSEIVIGKKRISTEAFLMANKPTYEELEQRVKALEKEAAKLRHTNETLWESEEALMESEERFRDLYENAPNAYFSISAADGSILRCNTAALRLSGYDRETLLGMHVFDLYADTPHGLSKAQEMFKGFQGWGTYKGSRVTVETQEWASHLDKSIS